MNLDYQYHHYDCSISTHILELHSNYIVEFIIWYSYYTYTYCTIHYCNRSITIEMEDYGIQQTKECYRQQN